MPLVFNVAFVQNSQANTTIWHDASLQRIGNVLSEYVNFTSYDITYQGTYNGSSAEIPAQSTVIWDSEFEAWQVVTSSGRKFIQWDSDKERWFFRENMPDGNNWLFYTILDFSAEGSLKMPWQVPLALWRKNPVTEEGEDFTLVESDIPWLTSICGSSFDMFIEIPQNTAGLKSIITRNFKSLLVVPSDIAEQNGSRKILNLSRVICRSSNPRMLVKGTWKFEFRPATTLDKITLYDKEAITNSITNLFRFIVGERILLPEYGNVLPRMIGTNITDAQIVAAKEAVERMMGWERRISLESVNISQNPDTYEIGVDIVYSIPTLKINSENVRFFIQVSH